MSQSSKLFLGIAAKGKSREDFDVVIDGCNQQYVIKIFLGFTDA